MQIGRSSYEERAAYVRSVYTNPSDRCFQELDDQFIHAVRAAALPNEGVFQIDKALNHNTELLVAQIQIPLSLSEHNHQPPSAFILCTEQEYGKCAIYQLTRTYFCVEIDGCSGWVMASFPDSSSGRRYKRKKVFLLGMSNMNISSARVLGCSHRIRILS